MWQLFLFTLLQLSVTVAATVTTDDPNYMLLSFGNVEEDVFSSYPGQSWRVARNKAANGLVLSNTMYPLSLDSLWNNYIESLPSEPPTSAPTSAPSQAESVLVMRDSKFGLYPAGTASAGGYAALIAHFCDIISRSYSNTMAIPPQMVLYQRHAAGSDAEADQYFFRHMEMLLRKGGYRVMPTTSVEFNISLPTSYYTSGSGVVSKWGIAVHVGNRYKAVGGAAAVAAADKLDALLRARTAAAVASNGAALGTVHIDELIRLANGESIARSDSASVPAHSRPTGAVGLAVRQSDETHPSLAPAGIDPASVSINTERTEADRQTPPALKVYNQGAQNSAGEEIQLLKNVLPQPVLNILADRLLQLPPEHTGATSFFLPFIDGLIHGNGSLHDAPASLDKSRHTEARNTIEAVIMELIVPQLFGSMEGAIQSDIIGCEWWIQTRSTESPKEYHMDTSITWCRDHGWATEFLPSCHFYPAVGSVYYIDGEGGPTAVFNQSSFVYGMSPTVPNEVGIIYPRKNQMLLFKGNRYHGVMRKNPLDPSLAFPSSTRKTLLINYWSVDKIAGESDTPTLKNVELELDLMAEVRRLGAQYDYSARRPVQPTKPLSPSPKKLKHDMIALNVPRVSIPSNFLGELGQFKGQYVPNSYIEALRTYKIDFIMDQYRVAANTLAVRGGAVDAQAEVLRAQLHRDLAGTIVTESAFFVHEDNPMNTVLARSGSVFSNWDRWTPRDLEKEERESGMPISRTDFTYATPIFLDIAIPPEEKGRMNPVFKLAAWRASMPGGDPHQLVIDKLLYSDFTNHFQA